MIFLPVKKQYFEKMRDYAIPEELLHYAVLLEYHKGERICREGEFFEYLLFLLSGKCKVCITGANGKSLLLSFYHPGTILGEVELMLDGFATSDVTAIKKTYFIGLPLKTCREALITDPGFLCAAATTLSKIVVSSAWQAARNVLYTLENRLCAYIVETNENGCFEENLTETAELLGTSYRHLLRTTASLCGEKILTKKSRTQYEITDGDALKKKAKDCFMEGNPFPFPGAF